MNSSRKQIHDLTISGGNDPILESAGSLRPLLGTTLLMLIGMTMYEVVKQWAMPSLSIWESHVITIFFSSSVAAVAAYVVLVRRSLLQQRTFHEVLERKRAVDQRRKSERIFLSAFDDAPIGIGLFKPDGRFVQVNRAFSEIAGYPREDLLGRHYDSLIHRDDLESGRENIGRLFTGESTTCQQEQRYLHKLGHEVMVLQNLSVVRDVENNPQYFIAQIQDITERKRGEAERRIISEIVQGVITTSNMDQLFALAHRAISRVLPAENCFIALHGPSDRLMHFEFWIDKFDLVPSPSPVAKNFTSHVLRTGQPLLITDEVESRLYADGEAERRGTKAASWLGVPLRARSRTIGVMVVQDYERENAYDQRDLEFLAAVGDQFGLALERKKIEIELIAERWELNRALAERELADESLRVSESRYRHLLEQSQGFICTHDYAGQLLSINPAAAQSLEYEPHEMIGRNLSDFVAPSKRHLFPLYLERIAQQTTDTGLLRVVTKSGVERMWRYHNALYEEPGQNAYVLGHAQDVTEFKLAEARLRNLSLTDELTGLQNPRGFFALATQYLKTARREGQSFAIIYADMDGLKQINDTYGHSAGSQAIKRVADLLRNSFRASDVIGRMGGDEFAILVADIAANNTRVPLTHLDEHLGRYNAQSSQPYELSVSIGMICAAGDTDASLEELLAQADQVMYENKKRKRQPLAETSEQPGAILVERLQTSGPKFVPHEFAK